MKIEGYIDDEWIIGENDQEYENKPMRKFRVDYVRGFNCFYNEGDYLDELEMIARGYMESISTIDEINAKCIWYRFSEIEED